MKFTQVYFKFHYIKHLCTKAIEVETESTLDYSLHDSINSLVIS